MITLKQSHKLYPWTNILDISSYMSSYIAQNFIDLNIFGETKEILVLFGDYDYCETA